MQRQKITSTGQISIPAAVRGRWGTNTVTLEDLGDRLVVKPFPDDPITAARGALKGLMGSTEELRAQARRDEADAESRRI